MATMAERIYQATRVCADTGLTNEIQTLSIGSGTPESGSMTVDNATSTVTLDFDSTAAEVEAALVATDDYEEDDIVCSGGPLPGTGIAITFTGRQEGNVAALTVTDVDLSAGTPAIATSTGGVDGLRKDLRDAFEALNTAMQAIWSTASTSTPVKNQFEDDIVALCRKFANELT